MEKGYEDFLGNIENCVGFVGMLFKNICYLKSIYTKNLNVFKKCVLGRPCYHY